MKPRNRGILRGFVILFSVVGVLIVAWVISYLGQFGAQNVPRDGIVSGRIQVLDGDTIRTDGQVYRLVGFDAPESGVQARCDAERTLAARATLRLREIVDAGGLRIERVPCACPTGTEGTQKCNYGRLCGLLTAAGRDVGAILITEGLARRYICRKTQCPQRQSWC